MRCDDVTIAGFRIGGEGPMMFFRIKDKMWLAWVLILIASVHGCSAWSGGTPSEMQASEGTTKTSTPAGVDDKAGVILQKQ